MKKIFIITSIGCFLFLISMVFSAIYRADYESVQVTKKEAVRPEYMETSIRKCEDKEKKSGDVCKKSASKPADSKVVNLLVDDDTNKHLD